MRAPVLLGARSEVFGICLTPPEQSDAGVVVCVAPSSMASPAGMELAEQIANAGLAVLVLDEPGQGESREGPTVEESLGWACARMGDDGSKATTLLVRAEALEAALALAASRTDVAGVVSLSVPRADRMDRLAGTLGTTDIVRRSLRPGSLTKLLDAGARERAMRLARAKLRGLGRSGRAEATGPGVSASPGLETGLGEALVSGARVLLLAGMADRGARDVSALVAGRPGHPGLQADTSFPGRIVGLDMPGSRTWVFDRVVTWASQPSTFAD